MRGANGQRQVEQSPRSGRLSFYIRRRGAGQRILAGGKGRRSCGPQPPEPALPLTAPRQGRGESRCQLLLAPLSRRISPLLLSGGKGRRSCGPQPPEPALPSTAPRQARIRAGPRRITLAAPSRAAVAAHFSFAFIRGFGPLNPRPSPPAIILGIPQSGMPAPQSSAKCRNSRVREAGDRKRREIPIARFAGFRRPVHG